MVLYGGDLDHSFQMLSASTMCLVVIDVSRVAVARYLRERLSRLCCELVILSFEINRESLIQACWCRACS